MNHNSYSNQELSYSEDDDGELEFQDQNDDVEMSYNSYPTTYGHNGIGGNNTNNNIPYNNNSQQHIPYNFNNHVGPSNINSTIKNKNINNNDMYEDLPSEVTRKKPGRKPGPACPALRKEQNRAAQRAFRDRKERHLQQLENMIKDLKSQHFIVISAYQREVRQLKTLIETLQSENYYLREVVFAFEAALSKGNHKGVLGEVKQELFRRHYESKANFKKQSTTSPAPETPASSSATPGTPTTPSKCSVPPTTPPPVSMTSPQSPLPATTASHSLSDSSLQANSSIPSATVRATSTTMDDHEEPKPNVPAMSPTQQGNEMNESEEGFYSLNGDILFKPPPLFIPEFADDGGELRPPSTPYSSISVPRPTYRPPGWNLPKYTDYQKHPNVFDELQSSLFPPGTLESLQINMATPQEVVSDDSLFAEPMEEEERNSTPKNDIDTSLIKIEDEEYYPYEGFINKVATTLGLRKESVPQHRLLKEFRILATAQPQTDPNIDPKIYELPHDKRIDYIPCPRLRAQMIVHQHRYDVDEVFQVLIDGAICHGPPLRRDSWQLPEAFFERFGFLLGLELDRIRNKTWPPESV